jgi:flagellar operon protein
MVPSDYLRARSISVTTGQEVGFPNAVTERVEGVAPQNSAFAKTLEALLDKSGVTPTAQTGQVSTENGIQTSAVSGAVNTAEVPQVTFSKHAVKRIAERGIDLDGAEERLQNALALAKSKNCSESLVMIDGNAFLVSVKNNKVITAMTQDDLQESIFTNIDSTVFG